MSFLHTLSGVLLLTALVAKIALHIYFVNGPNLFTGLQSFMLNPKRYLWFYKAEKDQTTSRKNICNMLLYIAMGAFVLNVVVGVLIYINA